MRYISLSEVLELHRRIIEESGGSTGLRDLGGLASGDVSRDKLIEWLTDHIDEVR